MCVVDMLTQHGTVFSVAGWGTERGAWRTGRPRCFFPRGGRVPRGVGSSRSLAWPAAAGTLSSGPRLETPSASATTSTLSWATTSGRWTSRTTRYMWPKTLRIYKTHTHTHIHTHWHTHSHTHTDMHTSTNAHWHNIDTHTHTHHTDTDTHTHTFCIPKQSQFL